jgi:HSP20 family protein
MFASMGRFDNGLLDDFSRFEQQMDELLGRFSWPATGIRSPVRGAFPPVNVGATPERVAVYLFAPGIDAKKLNISIQQNLLVVSGGRKVEPEKGAQYYRQERFSGEFRRVITLPDDVDPDRVEARYRDGVLQITVSRREAARPRQIAVN